MQRDEALAELREIVRDDEHGGGIISRKAARWALERIAYLEDIPNQIDGLAQCAEASRATPDATLLLKLAAAEQRIAELESERDEARSNHIWTQKDRDQAADVWMERVRVLGQRIAAKDAALDEVATTAEKSIGLQVLAIEDNVFEIARIAKEGRSK